MTENVIKEIDHNLYVRYDLKVVFDGFKAKYRSITNVNHMLVELKFDFIDKGVFEDIELFLFYLKSINYLSFSELRYTVKALENSDKEYFKEDSNELNALIGEVTAQLKNINLNDNDEIQRLYSSCRTRYDRYILQRALFREDVMIGMGWKKLFN